MSRSWLTTALFIINPNQPARHLEADESLIQAALRETLEETDWDVELTAIIGIYLYTARSNGITYQRVCFAARPLTHHPERTLDESIIGPLWLSRSELAAKPQRWRSYLMLRCIDDYLAGERFPRSLIRDNFISPSLPET